MVETWDAIRARRNVREFGDRAVSDADLDRILEAGRRSPSSRNWQPWDFIVVTDRERLVELSEVWRGAWHVAGSQATIAFVIPVPDSEREREIAHFDLGQAVMSMMLVAADVGLGTSHGSVVDQDLARRVLGFPGDRTCAHLMSVGYPVGRPITVINNPNRRPFEEVVHRERW
jgi:nitroreductase